MKEKWFCGLRQWTRLNLLLLACMVAVRPLFFLEVYFRVGLEPIHFFTILSGAIFDLLLVCRIFAYGLIPFLLIHRYFPKTAQGIFIGLIMVYAVVSALLSEYYCNLTMPLDHVILVYTPEELKTTVFSSASLSAAQVLGFVWQVAMPAFLIWCWKKVKAPKWLAWSVLSIALLTTVFVRYPKLIRKESLYPTHYDFCLAVNQPSYSYVKITDFIRDSKKQSFSEEIGDNPEVKEAIDAYHAQHPEFEYDHPGYPYYRKATDPDVLGGYFNSTSDGLPPNLVFIIVEGMGRRLTGVYNPHISFTPFVDSLASVGLFWPNCLSTSERTFGVLPSVFASAPHGRFGFSTPHASTPRHHSLLLDLEQNGYESSFYYGGDMSFDRYDFFMKSNHVDYLFMPQVAVEDSAQYKLMVENNRWGLDDDQLFQYAIAHQSAVTSVTRPFIDIYLTLSTHEPFVVDDIEFYEAQVKQMLEQNTTLSEIERNNIEKNLNIYGCYLYTDQSIKKLMEYYASRPNFDNTIFIITGDHRMAPVPAGIALRKYNVPLVVYSPLLKRHKTMNAMVSHLDITPSFNAYLKANYDYQIDDHCHWLGTSFDTTSRFQNTRKLAFMLNNRDVIDYVNGDYAISGNNLIKIDSNFVGTSMKNEELYHRLKDELDAFDLMSRFVVQNDLLLPQDANTILYNCHLDFEKNTLEVFDKYLVRGKGYLNIDQNKDYFSLCSNIAVRPLYEQVLVELSFDVKSADKAAILPLLKVDFGEQYHQQVLETPTGESLNTGEWEHFHTRMVISTLEETHTEALKIYLWNKHKAQYYLDNLVITVEGVKKN